MNLLCDNLDFINYNFLKDFIILIKEINLANDLKNEVNLDKIHFINFEDVN